MLVLCASCVHKEALKQDRFAIRIPQEPLMSINIIDRNGLTETVSTKERLKMYEKVDFLSNQPYKQVLRVWKKNKEGTNFSIMTSYHSNGELKQCLEVENGRAHGKYIEWFPNGQKKLEAYVVGGTAALDEKAQATWAFDKTSVAWDAEGNLVAKINYSKGLLEGTTTYYYTTGAVQKSTPYVQGEIEGEYIVLYTNGAVCEKTTYHHGLKEGLSEGFWEDGKPMWREEWKVDLLENGDYYTQEGTVSTVVKNGGGWRSFFEEGSLTETRQYAHGKEEGEVQCLRNGSIVSRYHLHDGLKHGEEIRYWPSRDGTLTPRLSILWNEGQIQGTVKTWYENGVLESSREMSQNKKQGLLMAWYCNGSVMLIEEYEQDVLKRGDYLKKDNKVAVSKVANGSGIATFFDKQGNFLKKVTYVEGKPQDDE